jgi:hypothetical protein
MPALHGADRTCDVTVTGIRNAGQGGGDLLQERIPVAHRQRTGGGEDVGHLGVGQSKRRYAAESAAGASAYAIWRP